MKKIIVLILLIISVVLISIGSRIMYLNYQEDKKNKQIITDIINSYSDYVKITNKKSVYIKNNDDYKEIGYLYKDTEVALVNKNVTSKDDIYYQIKGTDYYIDYLNMEKINNITIDNSFDNYLIGNTIKANPIKLYQNDILKIELNDEYNFDVYFIDNNKYYVKYLDQIYYIEGDYELTKKDNTDILTSISVLALDTGISNDKMDEILKYLKDNNYESISLKDPCGILSSEPVLCPPRTLQICSASSFFIKASSSKFSTLSTKTQSTVNLGKFSCKKRKPSNFFIIFILP